MKDPMDFVKPEELSVHRAERATNGFSKYDWWSFDTYLAWVIAGGLKKFRTEGHGYPADVTEQEWNILLDVMIEGFEGWLEKFETKTLDEEEELRKKLNVALDIFRVYFVSLWD
jgi:hypothetical protein